MRIRQSVDCSAQALQGMLARGVRAVGTPTRMLSVRKVRVGLAHLWKRRWAGCRVRREKCLAVPKAERSDSRTSLV